MKTRSLKTILPLAFAIFLLPNLSFSNSTETAKTQSIFDEMNHSEMLEITLEADFTTLNENRNTEDYLPGKITFEDKKELSQNWNIKIKPRGKYRRRICAMPPLKLKFKKDHLEEAGLARDFNDIKLVTHCTENRNESKDLLAREFLAYKLYNELTPYSFRVQWVKVIYVDTNTGKKNKNFGFIIEDKNQLAARMEAVEVDKYGLTGLEFPTQQEKLMSVFQYMIGNTDWNVSLSKNLKFFQKDETLVPVPYDFDFAGLVNAPYARPNPNFGLASIRERTFMGVHNSSDDLHGMKAYFKSKKSKLFKMVNATKFLAITSREDVSLYLDEFYNQLDDFSIKERQIKKVSQNPNSSLSK